MYDRRPATQPGRAGRPDKLTRWPGRTVNLHGADDGFLAHSRGRERVFLWITRRMERSTSSEYTGVCRVLPRFSDLGGGGGQKTDEIPRKMVRSGCGPDRSRYAASPPVEGGQTPVPGCVGASEREAREQLAGQPAGDKQSGRGWRRASSCGTPRRGGRTRANGSRLFVRPGPIAFSMGAGRAFPTGENPSRAPLGGCRGPMLWFSDRSRGAPCV